MDNLIGLPVEAVAQSFMRPVWRLLPQRLDPRPAWVSGSVAAVTSCGRSLFKSSLTPALERGRRRRREQKGKAEEDQDDALVLDRA